MAVKGVSAIRGLNMEDLKLKGFKVHELPTRADIPVSPGRRDFYKMGLVTGNMTIFYGDEILEINDTEGIVRTNHTGTVALANASMASGVKRFIFTSTVNVYGSDYRRPAREDDTVNINDQRSNSSSKISAENELISLHKNKGFVIRILCLGFVYGDRDPHIREIIPVLKN